MLKPFFDNKFYVVYDRRSIGGYTSLLFEYLKLSTSQLLNELKKFQRVECAEYLWSVWDFDSPRKYEDPNRPHCCLFCCYNKNKECHFSELYPQLIEKELREEKFLESLSIQEENLVKIKILERNINPDYFISSQKIISKSSKLSMKEFIINKFLKLRLEDGKTIIYVNNERFNQCKFLLLDIPVEEMTSLDDIESIDDVAQRLNRSLERANEKRDQFYIPPEVEFWGHCSNLQVWYENNYNTKLIHRNLAFPLLKKLMEAGDNLAKKMFKEEIAKRFNEGKEMVKEYLRKERYLEFLNSEEFCNILNGIKFDMFNDLLQIIATYSIIEKMSNKEFQEFIDSLDNRKLRDLVKNPKKSNQLNFLHAILEYLGEYKVDYFETKLLESIFNKIDSTYFDYLLDYVIDKDGYIDLPVLEALIYIDNNRMIDFLNSTRHKFRFGFKVDLWDFQYILNVLLRCFNSEELMKFLDKFHKDDLFQIILPKILGFHFLKMSDQKDLKMKQFITAFLLEEAGADDYRENLKKLGDLLADTFLSELVDRNGELNERIIKILNWIGGIPAGKLYKRLTELSNHFNIEKYKHLFY